MVQPMVAKVVNVVHTCACNLDFSLFIFPIFSQFWLVVTHSKATRFIPQLHETSITSPFIFLHRLGLGE